MVDRNPGQEKPELKALAEFSLPSQPGNERQVVARVVEAVRKLNLAEPCLERLKTAVAEATMNAIEHGNHYRMDLPVDVWVFTTVNEVIVRIRDHGGGKPIPESQTPDIEAKLAGRQSSRGWGLFLIKNMVDEVRMITDETHHTVELVLRLDGDSSDK